MEDKDMVIIMARALSGSCQDVHKDMIRYINAATFLCNEQMELILAGASKKATIKDCIKAFILRRRCHTLLQHEWENINRAKMLEPKPDTGHIVTAREFWTRVEELIEGEFNNCVDCFARRYGMSMTQDVETSGK